MGLALENFIEESGQADSEWSNLRLILCFLNIVVVKPRESEFLSEKQPFLYHV